MFAITKQKFYLGSKSFTLFRRTKDRNKKGIIYIKSDEPVIKTIEYKCFALDFWII